MIQFLKDILLEMLGRKQNRREALEKTEQMVDSIKMKSDKVRSIDDTIGFLMSNAYHIHYMERK